VADVVDLVPGLAQVELQHVGAEERACQVTQVQVPVRVRRGAGDHDPASCALVARRCARGAHLVPVLLMVAPPRGARCVPEAWCAPGRWGMSVRSPASWSGRSWAGTVEMTVGVVRALTRESGGIDSSTTAWAPIWDRAPTVTGPSTLALVPMITPSSMVGCRAAPGSRRRSRHQPTEPRVTWW